MLEDGWIFAYDGVVGNIHPVENDDGKCDEILNVIVGGTGKYAGANGMLIGLVGDHLARSNLPRRNRESGALVTSGGPRSARVCGVQCWFRIDA
jgi:hypothetical protein